eukprot:1160161-Pelagomonas_calceolata.AAC.4
MAESASRCPRGGWRGLSGPGPSLFRGSSGGCGRHSHSSCAPGIGWDSRGRCCTCCRCACYGGCIEVRGRSRHAQSKGFIAGCAPTSEAGYTCYWGGGVLASLGEVGCCGCCVRCWCGASDGHGAEGGEALAEIGAGHHEGVIHVHGAGLRAHV